MRDESLICVWNGDNSFLGFGSYEIPPLRMLEFIVDVGLLVHVLQKRLRMLFQFY